MNSEDLAAPMNDPASNSLPPAGSGRSAKPWIFLGCGCFALVVVGIAAFVAFVFYEIKDSEAGRLTTSSVKENSAARAALGEPIDTGWPLGSISEEGGGSGKASFTVSVKGSKGKGKYFASLTRENGQWRVVSARLLLNDGRSVSLEGGAVSSPVLPASGGGGDSNSASSSGGRSLHSDRSAVTQWTSYQWPDQPIHFEVPSDWEKISVEKKEIEFRSKDRDAYFTGNLTYFDQKIPFGPIMESLSSKAAAQLKREEILGYARKDVGPAQAILQIERRGDGQTTAVWNGYFDTPEFGTVALTFLLGAPTPQAFDKYEGQLGAILDSIRFH